MLDDATALAESAQSAAEVMDALEIGDRWRADRRAAIRMVMHVAEEADALAKALSRAKSNAARPEAQLTT